MTAEEIVKRYEKVKQDMDGLALVINDYNKCISPVSKKFLEKAMGCLAEGIKFVADVKDDGSEPVQGQKS